MKNTFFIAFVLISLLANAQWVPQPTGTGNGYIKIFFPTFNVGYAIDGYGGVIKTMNAGGNWIYSYPGHPGQADIFFTDTAKGYIAGYNGLILKTTNGGANWNTHISGTTETLRSIYFANDSIGYIVGDGNVILKTINGGLNWNLQTSFANNFYKSVWFTDINTGYAVGYSGTSVALPLLMKTTDGGSNWIPQSVTFSGGLLALCFPTANIGYIVGGSSTLLKTINAGNSWSYDSVGVPSAGLTELYFINADSGYAVGQFGRIFKTINGGLNWTIQYTDASMPPNFRDVFFTDANTGYVVTDFYSTIFQTTNGGVGIKENEFENNVNVYPNPTSNKLIIDDGKMIIEEVKIYNMLGKMVINTREKKIDVSDFAKGMYFINIQTEKGMIRKKFVKE